jgi:hypothetical protein
VQDTTDREAEWAGLDDFPLSDAHRRWFLIIKPGNGDVRALLVLVLVRLHHFFDSSEGGEVKMLIRDEASGEKEICLNPRAKSPTAKCKSFACFLKHDRKLFASLLPLPQPTPPLRLLSVFICCNQTPKRKEEKKLKCFFSFKACVWKHFCVPQRYLSTEHTSHPFAQQAQRTERAEKREERASEEEKFLFPSSLSTQQSCLPRKYLFWHTERCLSSKRKVKHFVRK